MGIGSWLRNRKLDSIVEVTPDVTERSGLVGCGGIATGGPALPRPSQRHHGDDKDSQELDVGRIH